MTMSEQEPALRPFDALIGTWATEATHPMLEGEIVPGTLTFAWLEGGRFLVQRIRNDHELFPDAICVIGAPEADDGLTMEYFDSRGVRRTYGVAFEDGVLRIWRDHPGFEQRYEATIGEERFEGLWQLARTPGDWRDDLRVVYRRERPRGLHLFAGIRVRSYAAARPWYDRLLGDPAFFPHDTEAVWTLEDDRSVYIVEDAEARGHATVTAFVDDLDATLAEIARRGLEPAEQATYPGGVLKAVFRDAEANEIGFAGAPATPR